ncbi:MAG TPA: Uma2 family endonuclease [Polyangiaceae bacterium]|nr:Uma2 family endonuclease [Polyangiaceae bacterium]
MRIDATDLTTFPDITVVCGERQLSSIDRNAVVNPTLLVEVTSPSSEDYDRGEKLRNYMQITSVRAVIFVSHRRPQVTVVERSTEGWQQREVRAGEEVTLATPNVSLSVDELYAGITLESSE